MKTSSLPGIMVAMDKYSGDIEMQPRVQPDETSVGAACDLMVS